MRSARFLRRLDQRILPPIGRALSGFSRGTRRPRLLMVIGSVMSLAVVVLTVYVATRSPEKSTSGQGPHARVGVDAGMSIPAYAQQAAARLQQRLADAPGKPTVALVALGGYVTPEQLAAIVGPTAVIQVYTHVTLPNQRTDVRYFRTYSHLINSLQEAARSLSLRAADQDASRKLVVGDTEDDQALRAKYARQAALYRAEAKAYGSARCKCVFAMVVYTTPEMLATLASADGVRAVDPLLRPMPLGNILFAPPRPEEVGVADAQDGIIVAGDIGG